MVLHKRGEQLYYGIEELINDHLNNIVLPSIINATNNGVFLTELITIWNHYKYSIRLIGNVAMHLDQVYVTKQHPYLKTIEALGIQLFRDHIFDSSIINDGINAIILNIINAHPKKDVFDWATLKYFCEMLIEIDCGSYFQNKFINPFLQKLFEYYFSLSEKLLDEDDNASNFTKAVKIYSNQQTKFEECFGSLISTKIEIK